MSFSMVGVGGAQRLYFLMCEEKKQGTGVNLVHRYIYISKYPKGLDPSNFQLGKVFSFQPRGYIYLPI